MKITRLDECVTEQVVMEGVKGALKQVPIGKADGAPNFSIRVFTLEPGGYTPHHEHQSEHLNYVLQGRGELIDGEVPKPIREGDYVLIEPNERHQYRNTGKSPLVFMCMVPCEYE